MKQQDNLAFGEALETIFGLMTRTNKYIDDKAPWKMGPDQRSELAVVLRECLQSLRLLALLLHPFMPKKTEEIWTRLGEAGTLAASGPVWIASLLKGDIPPFGNGQRVAKGDPLFMRKAAR